MPATIALASARVARPVDHAARRGDRGLQPHELLGQVASARALTAAPASRSSSQSAAPPPPAARLPRIVVVALPRLRRSWRVARAPDAWRRRGNAAPVLTSRAPPGSRPGASSARRRAGGAAPPPMCMRHELSAATQTSARGVEHGAQLVREHRHRRVGVLHRERAAEAAALLRARAARPARCRAPPAAAAGDGRPPLSSRSEWQVGW